MLDRIIVNNFKSYNGQQTLGPLTSFTAVIGPNGAGKSNLMDAISFVLGVRSATLRSAALKDLIYRSGRKRGDRKGKGRAAEEKEADEQDDDEQDEDEESDEDEGDGERTAWVMAVYKDGADDNAREWTFKRAITAGGVSEYSLNGKVVTYKKYNAALEKFNILVKAKNFLVFQGDVEQVASQSSADLAKLVDQISGSLDLKDEYDQAAAALQKATNASINQHQRRKGVNQERKQYKELKEEADRWTQLETQKEAAVIRHLVWKLYHIEQRIRANTDEIESKADQLRRLRADNAKADEAQRAAKKDATRAQKDFTKQEKALRKREKEFDDARPELLDIQARIDHATKKLAKADANSTKVEADLTPAQAKLDNLKADLATVQRALDRHRADQQTLAQQRGFVLSDADVDEYRNLRNQANLTAVGERTQLNTHKHEEDSLNARLEAARDALELAQRKLERLQAEEATLVDRRDSIERKMRSVNAELDKTKADHQNLVAERVRTSQTEQELNEKLEEVYAKLERAGADKQQSEREAKLKETLVNLKRTFPGVKGRLIDLCKPSQSKYSLAVTTVLGRNIDSVVVDNEKTAIACIEYMRVQRAGQATFIPLETVQVTRANDKFRTFAKGAHLAIDVISFDASIERAVQHACGSSLVCDTLEIAKSIVYDRQQEVKAVTLEGTVIHRSGLITGGASTRSSRHFEERELEGLKRREADLRAKLAEIFKTKPRAQDEEKLKLDMTKLESELTIQRDDLATVTDKLKGVQAEIRTLKRTVRDQQKQVDDSTRELDNLRQQQQALQQVVHQAEDPIFRAFCRRIGVTNIREYEQKQLAVQQEANASELKFQTQIKKLQHQIEFNQELVEDLTERLDRYRRTKDTDQASLDRSAMDKQTKEAELDEIEADIDELRQALDELQATLAEKNNALDDVRASGSKSAKQLDRALKEIAASNDEIEKLASERFAVYRRCKLEEIDLPLADGSASLDDVPIEEGVPDQPMDVDGPEDETQQAARVNDYGVVVDFDELDDEEQQLAGEEMEAQLLQEVSAKQAEMDKMAPNLRAIDRLGDTEERFHSIEGEFNQAREAAKQAKDTFNELKKRRTDLFNKAFTHIANRIDGVYKDLTKGQAAPQGGVAYLTLENTEEPYTEGIKYHAMPPMKRFRDMDQLSGGEKTIAALALLFAIHSYHPSPFFVLDEVDAALDNLNVSRIARYVKQKASKDFQFIVISLKAAFYEKANALVGIYRDDGSKSLTLDLDQYAE